VFDLTEQDETKELAIKWLLDSDYVVKVTMAAFAAAGHTVREEQTTWQRTGWFTTRMQVQLKDGTTAEQAYDLVLLVTGLNAMDVGIDTESRDYGHGFASRPSIISFTLRGRSHRVAKEYLSMNTQVV
jgi:hypothetical protein